MEIRIQIGGRVFSICFGRKTKWFQSIWWFCIQEEWYDNHYEVVYAKIVKTLGRE